MNEFEDTAEMEEWMQTWQMDVPNGLPQMREYFERRKLKRIMTDFGSLIAFVAGALALVVKAVMQPGPIVITAAVLFVPFFLNEAWLLFRRWSVRRVSLPLTGIEYVDALEHNLALDRRQLTWERRILLPATLVGAGIITWLLMARWDSLPLSQVVAIATIAYGGFGFSLVWAFVRKPRELAAEEASLAEIAAELRDD